MCFEKHIVQSNTKLSIVLTSTPKRGAQKLDRPNFLVHWEPLANGGFARRAGLTTPSARPILPAPVGGGCAYCRAKTDRSGAIVACDQRHRRGPGRVRSRVDEASGSRAARLVRGAFVKPVVTVCVAGPAIL